MRRSPHTISVELFREMKIKPKQKAKVYNGMKEFRKALKEGKYLASMKQTLRQNQINYQEEFAFVPGRKFRADIFIPELNLLVEYEGLIHNSTGKSGHTTIKGYSSNCTKYNFACTLGYKLLRYTATTYQNMMNDINNLKSI